MYLTGELGLVVQFARISWLWGVAERWWWMVGGVGFAEAADVDRPAAPAGRR